MKKVSHRKRRNTINMYIGTGQVPRIHEELITQQEKNSVKKKKKKQVDFEQILHKEDIWMANKHMKWCSTTLVIRGK